MSNCSIDVSIVIPSYQQGRYIEECVESVLSQKGARLEVFVFDACSSDATLSVLEKYRNRIDLFVERDLGQAHAIVKGLKRCRGRVIGYLNSDDVLLPGAIRQVIERFREDQELDLLYGRAHYIDETSKVIGDYKTEKWNFEVFCGECFVCQPAAFWSRRIMNHIGFFDQKLQCSMDYDYWMRIAKAGGKIVHLNEYLACSRDYPETKTRSLRGKVFVENFMLSLKRLGFIHADWMTHYLDHLKLERKGVFSILIPSRSRWRDRTMKLVQQLSCLLAKDVELREPLGRKIV